MASASAELPQLEVFNRMLELPVIELALSKSASTYSRFKDSSYFVNWALTTAESTMKEAGRQAAPYAKKLEAPINYVDHTLCRGLDEIERKVPIVKERPEQILENAYMLALETVRPAVTTISYVNDFIASQATNIKNISWNKMNEILSTHYGSVAIHGLDNTAVLIEMLLDKYFPPIGDEQFPESISMEKDKLLHTLQTVGRLSNKTAHRVYSHVVYQLRTLHKDNLRAYLSSLVEFLQLARYIDAINERVLQATKPASPTLAPATNNKNISGNNSNSNSNSNNVKNHSQ